MVKKVLKVCLAIGLILVVFSSSAFATTGTVTGSTVRIREKASSNSPEVSAATKGEKVEIIGEDGNWYQVKFEKITGYISKDYVDTDYSSGSSTSTTTVTTPEPEPEETPVETTQEPEEVNEPEETVQEAESTTTETQTSVPATAETKDYSENQTVTFENDTTLRYLPNFSSRSHGTASSGSTYTIKASLNNWVKVSNDTNSGWVLKNAIEGTITDTVVPEDTSSQNNDTDTSTTTAQTSKGKVNVDSARIRKSPNGDVLDSLSKGTEVTILDEEDGWYKISTEKYDSCYIAKRLITEN